MKYIGLTVLAVLLVSTWRLINHEPLISQQTHAGIQQDLKKIISDYIQQNLPQAKDLRFDRFWTETLSKDKVKASFLYSFDDKTESSGEARVQIDGFAILNRDKKDSNDQKDTWSFDELHVQNDQIEFKEPMTISPHGDKLKNE